MIMRRHLTPLLLRPGQWSGRAWGLLLLVLLLLSIAPHASQAQFYNNQPTLGVYNGPVTTADPFYSGDSVTNDTNGDWLNSGGLEIISGPATGTFTNNGAYLSQSGGKTQFTGPTTVEVGGTTRPTFFDLDLDNAGQLDLTNTHGALVNGAFTFTGTLVDNVAGGVNGALRFGTVATYAWSTGPDATHHVNGYVGADQTTGVFTYPVGTGTDYRPAQITAPVGAAVAYLASNPQGTASFATASLSGVFANATWQVDSLGSGKAITVSMPDVSAFAITTKLRLVGWNGTQWIDISGGPTATGTSAGSTLSGTSVSGLSAIGIGAGPNPLPVTLVSFTAAAHQQDARLRWVTATEASSAWFQVERSTEARTGFTPVGAPVAAAGFSQARREYAHTDGGVGRTGATFYYRLRLTAQDGSSTLSEVQVVRFTPEDVWTVSATPNPFGQMLRVGVTTTTAGPVTLDLFDMTGRRVLHQTAELPIGVTRVAIDGAAALPVGAYSLRVQQGTAATMLRVIRE